MSFLSSLHFWDLFLQQTIEKLSPAGKNISHEISITMDYAPRFYIDLGFVRFGVTDAILSLTLSMVIVWLLVTWAMRKKSIRPDGKQAVIETMVDGVLTLCKNSGLNEKQAWQLLPYVVSVAFLVITSNVLSAFKLKPASQNPVFPITLALMTLVFILFMTIRFIGFKGFFYAMLYPQAGLLPFKILDLCIKPISLSFRLFGNIFGAFILMEFMTIVMPLILPGILGIWFDVLDGVIQGGVFAYLTIVYIGEFIENAHHYEEILEEKKHKKIQI